MQGVHPGQGRHCATPPARASIQRTSPSRRRYNPRTSSMKLETGHTHTHTHPRSCKDEAMLVELALQQQ
ncbi:hypothetical protein BCV70DRAFT_203353 [Testicularia cyperi]|uniref:Uncharacterized protein n=1 Tax=Testicularia cyperi TaxID=1882483 RepID=A0A317XE74_9BASI|nr:hypothetical protein BCV70DRAFT_203353 [Testicularia cyperi]